MTQQTGNFVWFELLTDDVDQSLAHYEKVLGWKPRTMDMGEYTYNMLGRGEVGHCGVVEPVQAGVPNHWTSYVAVKDVDATVAKVEAAGGAVIVPPTDLPDVGRFARIADPEGASLNVFEAKNPDNSSTGFHWNELWCQRPTETLKFYERVLGAEVTSTAMPFGDYFMLEFDGRATGGVVKAPSPDMPAHWLPYATVDDADEATRRAQADGGTLRGEVTSVEGVVRFAIL